MWAGKDPTKDENITEALLAEGLAKVRDGGRNIPQLKRLVDIEDVAKSQGKGIWGTDLQVTSKAKSYLMKISGLLYHNDIQ